MLNQECLKVLETTDIEPLGEAVLILQDKFKSDKIYIANGGVGTGLELMSGTVLKCSPQIKIVKPGARVIFSHVGYSRMGRHKNQYVLLFASNIICLIDEKKEKIIKDKIKKDKEKQMKEEKEEIGIKRQKTYVKEKNLC